MQAISIASSLFRERADSYSRSQLLNFPLSSGSRPLGELQRASLCFLALSQGSCIIRCSAMKAHARDRHASRAYVAVKVLALIVALAIPSTQGRGMFGQLRALFC